MNLNLCFCFFWGGWGGGGGVHSFQLMSSLRAGSCHWNQVQIGGGCAKAIRNVVPNLLMCVCLCVWGSGAAGGVFFGEFFSSSSS